MKKIIKENSQGLKIIFERTCCRNFDSKKRVKKSDIRLILKAGQAAPSAKNRQPYFFIVIKNKKRLKEIAKAAVIGRQKQFKGWNAEKAQEMIKGNNYLNSNDGIISKATLAILILKNSDPDYKEASAKELDIKEEQGVACAAYSIMLAAWSLGLGSAWLCSPLYIKEELKIILEKYGVTWRENWEPRVIIPIGYPKIKLIKPKRKQLNEISHFIN